MTNPIAIAASDYAIMQEHVNRLEALNITLRRGHDEAIAESRVLREELERSDTDRIRLQAISSVLLGRLLAINDTIAGAVKAAVKDGIEATAVEGPENELRATLRRAAGMGRPTYPAEREAALEPLQDALDEILPQTHRTNGTDRLRSMSIGI